MTQQDVCLAMTELLHLMQCLRDPEHGCPWDRLQDFRSIAPHTLEEVYEVVDAIERGDKQQLREELGDLLFQIVFYAQLGREQGMFDFAEIAASLTAKLVRRHPHVFPGGTLNSFGTATETSAERVVDAWEEGKAVERQKKAGSAASALDDVPLALPALPRAAKLQKRAAVQGFDWSSVDGVVAKLDEELAELKQALEQGSRVKVQEEFGDLLFTVVNLSRHLELEAEHSLRVANAKFERRFRAVERLAAIDGVALSELSSERLEQYWRQVKEEEIHQLEPPGTNV